MDKKWVIQDYITDNNTLSIYVCLKYKWPSDTCKSDFHMTTDFKTIFRQPVETSSNLNKTKQSL